MVPQTVCVVDDDDAVRDSLGELLQSHGFAVRAYDSALRFLSDRGQHATECDCLVLDLHMPSMNGLELLELLNTRRDHVPVIVMTGRSDSALKERARRAGAVVLLDKPIDEGALMLAISRSANHRSKGFKQMLKSIRLELARSTDHPTGDLGHGYLFRAPLDATGHLDEQAWNKVRDLCLVHHFENGRDVETGVLHRTRGGRWVFSYAPGTEDDEPIFRLSTHAFAPGEYVSITEHDGVERTFRVTDVQEWHPAASNQKPAGAAAKGSRP